MTRITSGRGGAGARAAVTTGRERHGRRTGVVLLAVVLAAIPLSAGWVLNRNDTNSVNDRAAATHLQVLIADIDGVTTAIAIAVAANTSSQSVSGVVSSLQASVIADLASLGRDMADTGLSLVDIQQETRSLMAVVDQAVPLLGTAAIKLDDPAQRGAVDAFLAQHHALIARIQDRMVEANRRAHNSDRYAEAGRWGIVGAMTVVLVAVLWQAERRRRRIALVRGRHEALLASEERLRSIVDTALSAVVTMNAEGLVTGWSAQAEVTFGWPAGEVVGRRLSATIVPERYREAHDRGLAHFLQTGDGPVLATVVDVAALHHNGSEFPVELAISPAGGVDGDLTFVAFIRDITERKRAESVRAMQVAVTRALSDATTIEAAAPRILEAIATALGAQAGAIWAVDAATAELATRHSWHSPDVEVGLFEEASGRLRLRSGDGLPGRVWASGRAEALTDLSSEATFHRSPVALAAGLVSGAGFPIAADGAVIGVLEFFARGPVDPWEGLTDVVTDLGQQVGQFMERRRAETVLAAHAAELAAIAATDALTGLKNRREFDRILAAVPRQPFAVLVIDVDNLKEVNDEYGHEGGDVVLQAVAMTLSSLIRGCDVVARIGGDEFAAILPGAGAAEAESAAERLRVAMHSISVPYGTARVSIGWADAPAGAEPTSVRNAADDALYRAKRGGRDRVEGGGVPAVPVAGSARPREAELVSRVLLDHAIGVAYQPIVALDGRRVIGFEALARPDGYGATASVESLFRAARGLGRIRDLDWLCRRVAIERAGALPPGAVLFINVSSSALLDPTHGVDHLLLLLEWGGRRATDLVLEITEQEVVRDLGRLRIVVAAYREHGIRFALDDVGEGHSTLELLAAANPEFLKIGRSLTTAASRGGPRSAIEAAAAFARSNGGQVIAEGIEDEATAVQMADLGIALGQGYWLGMPAVATRPGSGLVGRVDRGDHGPVVRMSDRPGRGTPPTDGAAPRRRAHPALPTRSPNS